MEQQEVVGSQQTAPESPIVNGVITTLADTTGISYVQGLLPSKPSPHASEKITTAEQLNEVPELEADQIK